MSITDEVEDDRVAQRPAADTGLPAYLAGSAVLVDGVNEEGHDSLALWVLSPGGVAGGAWVATRARLEAEPNYALGLLNMVGSRALLGSSSADSARLLTELTVRAGAPASDSDRRAALPDAVEDLRWLRQRLLEETSAEPSRTGRKPAAISWQTDIAKDAVESNDDVLRLAGLAAPRAAPVASEALTIAAGLRWITARWLETTQVWNRRSYLQDVVPEPSFLPTRLAAAMGRLS